MIVWGGSTSSGARYNPATNVWAPISTVDEPPVITNHISAWSGAKMFIWGGTFDNTGSLYDPQSDTWSPISIAGAPTPYGGTMVWDGEAFIVWGAGDGNDGSRYIVDNDDDGLADGCDNCPLVANFDQTNGDGDAAGWACDCNDSDATVYPGATDVCDGLNNDCDDPAWPSVCGNPR